MRGWIILASVLAVAGAARATPRATGMLTDAASNAPVANAKVEITGDQNESLGSGTSSANGAIEIALRSYDGTHVYCAVSSSSYEAISIALPFDHGNVTCKARLKKTKGIVLTDLTVTDDGETTITVRARITNESAVPQIIDRFDIGGIWKSEQTCADQLPTATYDIKPGPKYALVHVRDDAQQITAKSESALRIAENRCTHTCMRAKFLPSLSMPANGHRLLIFNIDRDPIQQKTRLPQGTDAAFRLRAYYAKASRFASAENPGPDPQLLDSLTDDVDCRLPP